MSEEHLGKIIVCENCLLLNSGLHQTSVFSRLLWAL